MSATTYLINLVRRAAMGKEIHTAEKVNIPRIIAQNYGDKDGVLEWSDLTDTLSSAAETVGEVAGEVSEFIGDHLGDIVEAIFG